MTKSLIAKHLLVSVACVTVLSACSEDKKAKAQQRVVEKRHDVAQCPTVEGHFRLANNAPGRPLYVDIGRDQARQVTVKFDSNDTMVANGKEQNFTNGAKYSVGCVNRAIQIAGTNEKGERVRMDLVGTEKGVDANISEPSKLVARYEKTTIGGEALDKAGRILDQKNPAGGIPTPDDVKKK